MNENALQTLEYGKIKDQLASYALSKGARKLVEELHPSLNISVIEERALETTEARRIIDVNPSIPLSAMEDMDEVLVKLRKGAILNPAELGRIGDLLGSVKRLRKFMNSMESTAPSVSSYAASMYECQDLREEIERCINLEQVSDHASSELGRIRKKMLAVEPPTILIPEVTA